MGAATGPGGRRWARHWQAAAGLVTQLRTTVTEGPGTRDSDHNLSHGFKPTVFKVSFLPAARGRRALLRFASASAAATDDHDG